MDYTGIKNIVVNEEQLGLFYSDEKIREEYLNQYEIKENQYMILRDENNNAIDYFISRNGALETIPYCTIDSAQMGLIKPRNPEQRVAFHMLKDDKTRIKVISGPFGSGKTMSVIAAALSALDGGKYEKIVFVRNNIGVRDTNEIGFLPGEFTSKMLPWLMPMADHLGSQLALEDYISSGKIEPVHLGFLRGRDLKNSLIMVTEAQNISIDHMKLLVGRVGEGSTLCLDGDFKAQVDRTTFEKSSGLKHIITRLSGNENFAYVHLIKSERSKIAALAELLD